MLTIIIGVLLDIFDIIINKVIGENRIISKFIK